MSKRRAITMNHNFLVRIKNALQVSEVKCDTCGKTVTVGMKVFHSRKLLLKDRYGYLSRHSVWFRCENCYEKGFQDSQSRPKGCDSS